MLSKVIALSVALQSPETPSLPSSSNQNLNFWLVIAGLAIIFLCLLTVFLPNIKEFITRPQEFNLSKLGVNMKVSILTVFVLMGFVLSLSSFALQWQGYGKQVAESDRKIIELQARIRQKEEEEVRSRKFDMSVLVRPVTKAPLSGDWNCTYQLTTESGEPSAPVIAKISHTEGTDVFRVGLKDITLATRIYSVTMTKGKQQWTTQGFSPLQDGQIPADGVEK